METIIFSLKIILYLIILNMGFYSIFNLLRLLLKGRGPIDIVEFSELYSTKIKSEEISKVTYLNNFITSIKEKPLQYVIFNILLTSVFLVAYIDLFPKIKI